MTDVTVYTTSNLFLKDKQHMQSQERERAGVYLDVVTCVPSPPPPPPPTDSIVLDGWAFKEEMRNQSKTLLARERAT